MKAKILETFKKLGISIRKYPTESLKRRKIFLEESKIDLVLDIGANKGQYAKELINIGYKGSIKSFEPLKTPYQLLKKSSSKFPNWHCYNYGFGDKIEDTEINVSKNFVSSSILELSENSINAEAETRYVDKEKINLFTLDSKFLELKESYENVYLKLDVQGFESNILKGAINMLTEIRGIQLELSIKEMYKGELLYDSMVKQMNCMGFDLFSLETGFWDKNSGQLLQVDGIFQKK